MIGPGRIVLIAGPSGAGKDTLIAGARTLFNSNPEVFFPRRIVTRQSSTFEDHDSMTDAHFDCARVDGQFALWWEAHGNKYAIPATVDDRIRAGHTTVCNVSRTVIGTARKRYQNAIYVLITAPPDVLVQRITSRQRESDTKSIDRISRTAESSVAPDLTIDNVGLPEAGIRKLAEMIARGSVP
jgi:ribose 1,5-bisphosphokinase